MANLPEFARKRTLPRPPDGWFDYGYAVLARGVLALIRVDQDIWQDIRATDWLRLKVRLSVLDDGGERDAAIVRGVHWPHVERMPDGRWLQVTTRAEPGEANAFLFHPDGSAASRFAVGDGVSCVAVDPDGMIWVGYFDEGIFSRDHEGNPQAPGAAGLACFDSAGTCLWRFEHPDYVIDDCYTISLSGRTLWTCTYQDKPIIRIQNNVPRLWRNPVKCPAVQIAAIGDHVILGGWQPHLLRLGEEQAIAVDQVALPQPHSSGAGLFGRDGVLHAVGDGAWLTLAIPDWLAALT